MKHKKIIVSSIILVIGGAVIAYVMAGQKGKTVYTTKVVKRGHLIQTVSETGMVKAANEIDLSFLNTGKIEKMHVNIGDKVKKEDLLAELDYSSLAISEEEAQANLDVAQANLNKLLAGATAEEIAVAEASVEQAKVAYEAANKELDKSRLKATENIAQAQKTLNDLELKTENDVTTYEQAITAAETSLINTKATYQRSIDNYKETSLATIDDNLAKANTTLDTIDRTINDEDGKDNISVENLTYLVNTKNTYDEALVLLATANSSLAAANFFYLYPVRARCFKNKH